MGNVMVHDLKYGHCGEYKMPKTFLSIAESHGVKKGSCASIGYTHFVKNQKKKIPVLGLITF